MKIAIALPAVASALVMCAAAPSPASGRPHESYQNATPNSCIAANGGDWNACNVGNSGGGDLPYRPTSR